MFIGCLTFTWRNRALYQTSSQTNNAYAPPVSSTGQSNTWWTGRYQPSHLLQPVCSSADMMDLADYTSTVVHITGSAESMNTLSAFQWSAWCFSVSWYKVWKCSNLKGITSTLREWKIVKNGLNLTKHLTHIKPHSIHSLLCYFIVQIGNDKVRNVQNLHMGALTISTT